MDSILIVEDSISLASLLRTRIEGELGLEVVLAHSFASTRQILESPSHDFFLAVLDINLPDSTDGELVDYLQARGIPSMVLTGSYQHRVREQVQKKGVLDYFVKDNIGVVHTLIHAIDRIRRNSRIRVLVVDDSRSSRLILGRSLHQYGFVVMEAEDGKSALDKIGQEGCDLVITDFEMPVMDGIALTKKLRTRYSPTQIAVIGLSSHTDQNLAVQFIKAGASDFLAKPYQPEELLCRVYQNIEIIERHRELEFLVERHRSVLTHALDTIITTDPQGRILDYNPAAESLFGYPRDVVMGKPFYQFLIPDHLVESYRLSMERFRSSGASTADLRRRLEIQGRRADGKIIDLQVSLVAIEQQGQLRFTAFVQDITDRKQLLISLEETLSAAESANKAKSDFIANVSHEIRTPMNAVIGYTDLCLKQELPPRVQDYLDKINSASHSLMGIISDILDFSKMEAGRMELDPVKFDLQQLLDRLANLFSKQTADKGIELVLYSDPLYDHVLWGDALRLEQVLINLIRNAVKFTESGTVVVEAIPEILEGERIRLSFAVRDTGIGIDPEKLPQLFSPFVQADGSTTRKYGGTGLGLTICKRLVEMMGGEVLARSAPGQGSEFSFCVTVGLHSENRRQTPVLPAECHNRRALLLLEHPVLARQMDILLRSVNLDPIRVNDGEAALEQLLAVPSEEEAFAFCFIDWNLSGKDGVVTLVELLAVYHAHAERKGLPPFVLLTPFGVEDIRHSGEKAGFSAFLDKPLTRPQLLKILMQLQGKTWERHELRHETLLGLEKEASQVAGSRVLLAAPDATVLGIVRVLLERVGVIVESTADENELWRQNGHFPYHAVLFDESLSTTEPVPLAARLRQTSPNPQVAILVLSSQNLDQENRRPFDFGIQGILDKPIRPERLYGLLLKWLPRHLLPGEERSESNRVPSNVPGIDYQDAMERLAGNERLYHRLTLAFLQEYRNAPEQLDAALDEGRIDEAVDILHGLKGFARQIGAVVLCREAHHCEEILPVAFDADTRADYTVFRHQLTQVLAGLVGTLPKPPSRLPACASLPEGTGKDSVVITLLGELASYLDDHSLEAEKCLEELQRHLATSPTAPLLAQMARQLKGYHFPETRSLLNHLAEQSGLPLQPVVASAKGAKPKILIVDDQQSNVEVLCDILTDYDCCVALNGRQALQLAAGSRLPDLILLDIMMPEMNGYDCCQQLKEDERTSSIPVIFVTAKKELHDEVEGFRRGGVDFITKPFRNESVLRRVVTHLELKRHRDYLQEEVEQRTRELQQAREEAERRKESAEAGNMAKSRFLATMSHEIRTPMNAILGMGDVLLETSLSQEQRDYVMKFREVGNNLLELINQILDLSKIEAGRLVIAAEPVNVSQLMQESASLLGIMAKSKGLMLEYLPCPERPTWLMADAVRLRQVLFNLLGNAVKFTPQGRVCLREACEPNEIWHIRVEDSGIGISPEELPLIFDAFTQADSSVTRRFGGTGLGLAISRRLVEAMHGSIWAESQPGKGSVFHIALPLREAPPPSITPPPPTTAPLPVRSMRILLVEDSEDNQMLIRTFLRNSPHSLEIAENGQTGLERATTEPFDLIFMDVQMPVMDGYTATRRIRQWELENTARPHLFIVALTAHALEGEETRSREAGCDLYLAKPIRKQRLLEVIQEFAAR
ncbi:MAG: response regulator [Magnetococcales bacterium]|nr:response regulator [Magnetococcales bacterium]